MLRKITLLLLALSLLACSKEREVQGLVRQALKDPESARFEGATNIIGEGDAMVVCGLVNAKNGFGGYVGAQPYMIWSNRLYMTSGDNAGEVSTCCSAVYSSMLNGRTQVDPESAVACSKMGEGAAIIAGKVY